MLQCLAVEVRKGLGRSPTFHSDHTKALPLDYRDPFNSAITFPQLVSESNVMALLLAVFSTQSGQANSSLSGASRSMAGEMIVPISRPHFLHFMLSGKDINALPQLSNLETLGRVYPHSPHLLLPG
jgi:hypothetical protein